MGIILLPANVGMIDVSVPVATYNTTVDDELLSNDDLLREVEFYVPAYMGSTEGLALMGRMPRLRVCQLLTAGFDHAVPFLPAGVRLCNAAGVHDASTSELAVGLIIASLRGIDDAARDMPAGRWDSHRRPALADRHVVVVGAGGVGSAIQRRLEPFEVTITMVARSSRPGVVTMAELPALLPTADVVILAVPLDVTTEHLVDRAFLAAMPDGSLLVNVARGKVVDTDALVAELESGRLRTALDVTDPEPLPPDHPLWRLPGALVTPHVGGNSSAFLPRARQLVTRQVSAWIAGDQLQNVVVPAR